MNLFFFFFFFWIAASVAGTAAVSPNGIKTLLAKGLTKLFINDNPLLNNGLRSLLRSPSDCTILDS